MADLKRPITEASYLTAENVERYRAVMRFFYEQHQRMRYRLTPEEVVEGVKASGYLTDYTLEQCQQDLEQLEAWKNLTAQHDGRRVNTIEEYRRKSFRYQMTKYAVEIERMVSGLENIRGFGGSLEPTRLEKIAALLTELKEAAGTFPQGKALPHWEELLTTFRLMTESAADYIAHLESSRVEELMATESFLIYKDSLTHYLRNFMQGLQRYSLTIEALLKGMDATVVERYIRQVSQEEAAKPQLDEQESAEERLERLRETWESFAGWFLGRGNQESEVRGFERATKNTIAKIVRSALRIQESRRSGVSRQRELEHLGRWFFSLKDIEEAHQLAAYAFGLYKTRHFQGSDPGETESPDASMWDEPPQVRALTSKSRRRLRENATSAVRSRRGEQAQKRLEWLERRREEEQLMKQFLERGEVVMEALPHLSRVVFSQLLVWLGQCLASPSRSILTSEGIRIQLTVPPDNERTVVVTDDGQLEMPNYRLRFSRGIDADEPTAENATEKVVLL
jgi:uncharacterized protein (TIGR02677 family)